MSSIGSADNSKLNGSTTTSSSGCNSPQMSNDVSGAKSKPLAANDNTLHMYHSNSNFAYMNKDLLSPDSKPHNNLFHSSVTSNDVSNYELTDSTSRIVNNMTVAGYLLPNESTTIKNDNKHAEMSKPSTDEHSLHSFGFAMNNSAGRLSARDSHEIGYGSHHSNTSK